MNKTILVVGGAGYIGSHMVKMLLEQGYGAVVLDDLSTGYEEAVLGGEFIRGDLGDTALLSELFTRHQIDAVMHFAAFIQVGESVEHPSKYYHNNVCKTLNLLDSMVAHGINHFIFSSSAAIFGEPQYVPVDEEHPKAPINPYGLTKLMVEQILQDFDHAYGLKSICLRYFNAAGADPDGELGPRYPKVSNLIPVVLKAASGRSPSVTVFGRDYETPDGTGVRDYIHILDLCQAHLLALKRLWDGSPSGVYNLGNGKGFSVQQVIDMAHEVSGRQIPVLDGPRRAGDPASLVADSKRAQADLGWKPEYGDLRAIVEHAWQWEKKQAGLT
ncbi:MAG: UDP-glucose 4-epimerase GalE [Gammaproteobacteria bacterium]